MVAEFFGAGGEGDAALGAAVAVEAEADDAAAFAGEDGGAADALLERVAGKHDAGLVFGGDQLVVAGVVALDQLGGHLGAGQVEADVAAVAVEVDLDAALFVGEQPFEFAQGAGGDGDLDRFGEVGDDLHVVDGEAEAVGGGEREAIVLFFVLFVAEAEVDAGQNGASVVGGGGEDDVAERFAEFAGDDFDCVAVADAGDVGVAVGAHAVDAALVGVAGADLHDL